MFLSKSVRITLASFVAVFLLIALPGFAKIDPANIMGMWLFNEGKGGTATDSSENGNDGEIHGAKWVDGKFGKALEFDGASNWVEVPHSNTVGFKAGVSFTITLHFKGTKVAGALVGKNYEDTSQVVPWYLLWNGGADNKVTLYLRDSASTSFRADGTTEIGDDKWHFVVGRADASTGKASIWIDGKMEKEVDFNEKDGYGTGEGVFHIGRHYDRYTEGIIDDVALFNVALEEEDMDAIMDNGVETAAAVEPVNKLTTTWAESSSKSADRGKTMKQVRTFSVQLANRKLAIQMFAFALLLFAGLNCGTENPSEETGDPLAVETTATGSFYGDVALIEDVTIYMRFLKAGQILAQVEFEVHGVKSARPDASLFASVQSGVGNYHLKEAEAGDYTVQISAKGYQTIELNVTVIPDQSVSLDKVELAVLEMPVSHLRGVLTNEMTGEPIGGVNLQLKDNAGKIYETLTTVTGVFSFENLPVQQSFTLTIADAGYEGKEVTVPPIPAAETSELTVELTPLQAPERLDPGQGLSIGSPAPAFELPDGNNTLHALADYTADKNVVLIFYRGGW